MDESSTDKTGRRATSLTLGALADRLGVSVTAIVVGVLGVAAAGLGGWWALRSPEGPPPEAILPMADAMPIPTPTTPEALGRIVVDVVGEVASPGVHERPSDSRVADAVAAAGGLTSNADHLRLNLAEPLADGTRLWVPAIGEEVGPQVVTVSPPAATPAGAAGSSTATSQSQVNINNADAPTLESLPGIGPVLAAAIVEHRERSGPFASVEELVEVSGIGPAKLEQIRSLATV